MENSREKIQTEKKLAQCDFDSQRYQLMKAHTENVVSLIEVYAHSLS